MSPPIPSPTTAAHFDHAAALAQARALVAAGADILDVGGESTRPFAEPVPLEEELRRVIPVIETIAPEIAIPISIDTYKASVARAALDAGASIINDISALRFDPEMAPLAAAARVAGGADAHAGHPPGHAASTPTTTTSWGRSPPFSGNAWSFAVSQGIARELHRPGPGPRLRQNLGAQPGDPQPPGRPFWTLGCPLLVGPSRKAFIGHLLDLPAGPERDVGTLAALLAAVQHGARIVRTHNVAYARQFLAVWQAIFQTDRV